ncbi:MAG: uncharacterized protein PWQ41_993 [Bacillota bacterium]|jgi:hypothetical protein|nr:uncharacterized protein [Bacillota bacterium]MDK2855075.1 uncharacterized protein [Bacillota bacterium]MDK2925219.1 uncharacterized protein [Bacillota bacterium]
MLARKRLILGIALSLILILSGITAGLWYLFFHGLSPLSRLVLLGLGVLFAFFILIALLGLAGVVLIILRHRPLPFFERPVRILITRLLPLVMYLGRIFNVAKEKLERSFIEINNTLVRTRAVTVPPSRLLILAPHCLQYSGCPHKITVKVDNCRLCGRCQIKDLLLLARELGVQLAVVTGGTLARKRVAELRPKAVVAVACERDLTSGLQDVYPLPAVGILNDRPHGPCVDTRVDMERVRQAVLDFLGRPDPKGAL